MSEETKPKTAEQPRHTLRKEVSQAEQIRIALIGAGGNGAQMLSGLARLDRALRSLGHKGGLDVTVWDDDIVTTANVGRQLFSPADTGQHKATVLLQRVNMFFGLDWKARVQRFPADPDQPWTIWRKGWGETKAPHILISCVDTAKARAAIHKAIWRKFISAPDYWLDLGNGKDDGQVVLGCVPKSGKDPTPAMIVESQIALQQSFEAAMKMGKPFHAEPPRLPCITEIFPEMLAEEFPEDDTPSCSLAEALAKQSLFVNQAVTTFALDLLWRLLHEGSIAHHGAFINLASGEVNPLSVGGPSK